MGLPSRQAFKSPQAFKIEALGRPQMWSPSQKHRIDRFLGIPEQTLHALLLRSREACFSRNFIDPVRLSKAVRLLRPSGFSGRQALKSRQAFKSPQASQAVRLLRLLKPCPFSSKATERYFHAYCVLTMLFLRLPGCPFSSKFLASLFPFEVYLYTLQERG